MMPGLSLDQFESVDRNAMADAMEVMVAAFDLSLIHI